MIAVHVAGTSVDLRRFCRFADQAQSRFRFGFRETGDVALSFVADESQELFTVTREGIAVSSGQSAGISWYAGIEHERFLLICSLLGLTTWRTLSLNPILKLEDLHHPESDVCLFAPRAHRQDYALLFDRFDQLTICPGCIDFFRCLGAEPEIDALLTVLNRVGDGGREPPPSPRKN